MRSKADLTNRCQQKKQARTIHTVAPARLEVQHPAETSTVPAPDVAATTHTVRLAVLADTVVVMIPTVPLAVLVAVVVAATAAAATTRTVHLVAPAVA